MVTPTPLPLLTILSSFPNVDKTGKRSRDVQSLLSFKTMLRYRSVDDPVPEISFQFLTVSHAVKTLLFNYTVGNKISIRGGHR
jgi:hypothetical protein